MCDGSIFWCFFPKIEAKWGKAFFSCVRHIRAMCGVLKPDGSNFFDSVTGLKSQASWLYPLYLSTLLKASHWKHRTFWFMWFEFLQVWTTFFLFSKYFRIALIFKDFSISMTILPAKIQTLLWLGFKMAINIVFLKFCEFLFLLWFCFGCLSFLCGNVSLHFVICSCAVIVISTLLSYQLIFFLLFCILVEV